ncbi:phosphoglycerate mutase-like protein [Karstenula rhodostoma CBS 690.94]|uniref:Phosphoglycerate mutase-like protein n=1 Tax=Karstenula rhodostoma CBS 690.94 TaxID=1392251 RepID=A0A9P4PBC6_9PLEO|nr:phosphoglycerate mutase-like protein [Karstenula rhodostoma CBS 690.94]
MWCSTLFTSILAAAATVDAYGIKKHVNYEVVTGVFKQDDAATEASSFNFTAENFGLIERKYPSDWTYWLQKPTSWQRLNRYIESLNLKAKHNERYTLLFLGRHGEGYHNAAETYFGTPAWNCYWSEKDGNSTVTWADAHLTPKGVAQAQDVNKFWKKLLTKEKIAAPQSYYTSPLFRCLDTARLTFAGLPLPKTRPFVPTIKEYFREGISAHTCDRRSTKSYIHANFPTYRFERGFAEHDPYWTALHAEPAADQDIRSKTVLDDVFASDRGTYISVTAHSGEIASLLRVLGHRVFGLSTGAAIPVLVKATTVVGSAPATSTLPYAPQKTCAVPPAIRDSSCNDCSCCT